jgi:hypothetical protein
VVAPTSAKHSASMASARCVRVMASSLDDGRN